MCANIKNKHLGVFTCQWHDTTQTEAEMFEKSKKYSDVTIRSFKYLTIIKYKAQQETVFIPHLAPIQKR